MSERFCKVRTGLGMVGAFLLLPLLFAGIFVAWLSDRWSDGAASALILFLRSVLGGG